MTETAPAADAGSDTAADTGSAAKADAAGVDDATADQAERPLVEGDLVLLVDAKGRRYLVTLAAGTEFQTHAGVVPHEQLIGRSEGIVVSTTKGQRFTAYRPSLSDYILAMPRGAQVIYPKDIGPILMLADIEPGCRVFESGVGSGALSMGMLRTGATIVGYELREDFAARATKNVRGFLGPDVLDRYDVHLQDSYQGIDHTGFDRAVLDLPEPWRVVPHLADAMRPGAIVVSYSPSIIQVTKTREALDRAGFAEASTMEVLNRNWHIDGNAVRPDHRMVAHTGFLTRARRPAR
ncbi:MAG: tRNA (adenine-N1)-methyltransferase [Actinomycetota bacterium]